MEIINDGITGALLQLFQSKVYLPLYPFKLIVQHLLREEASKGFSGDVIDYASIPTEEMHLQIKMVLFGDSGLVGTKHLVKLISATSVKELKPTMNSLRNAFGNQVMHTKTDRIEATFIEVFHVNSCFGLTLVKPRQHRVDMTIEAILKGKMDESINLFIRRILEDAHTSETSGCILTSSLTASIRGVDEVIDVYTMRDKRQQVVNTLKSAVLDEGDICLECLVATSKCLLGYGDNAGKAVESTMGFTRVRRWYKLSYRDESDPTSPIVRCFARNPLHSVALGVFASLKDADLYVGVLADHLKRMQPKASRADAQSDLAVASSENATLMLNDLVNSLCAALGQQLEQGELSDAGESMLLVLALMTCQRSGQSHAMQQVRRLTYSAAAHVSAVRDGIRTLQQALTALAALVQQSPAVLNQLRGNALSEHELQQLAKLHSIHAALAPAVKQLRSLLLELITVDQHSELQYLAQYLMSLLWQLFDPVSKGQPLLSADLPVFREKGIASAVTLMSTCNAVLGRLCAALHIVELTAGTEILISTIKQDLMSYRSFTHNAAATLGLGALIGRNRGNPGAGSDGEESTFPTTHSHRDLPKCLSDLIGYAAARAEYMRSSKLIHSGNYAEFTWRPAGVSRLLRRQLLPEEGRGSGETTQLSHSAERRLGSMTHLWDLYAMLGEYNVPRFGGVDFPALLREEWERYDVPKFMCIEGAKLRYLTNTQVTRALHEGMFSILTGPTARPPMPALCRHMFRFPPLLPLWQGIRSDILQDYVMQPARRCWIQQLTAGSGLHIVKLRNLPESVRLFVSGGVLASDRVLSGLGANIERVFLNSWQIPPLFATPPASRAGMQVKVYTGVALTTAAEWCRPSLPYLRKISKLQDAREQQEEDDNEDTVGDDPPMQPPEKRRFFGLFSASGGKGTAGRAAERTLPDSVQDAALLEAGQYCYDDEEEQAEAELESGALRTLGEVELEVVVRVNFESAAVLDQVRAAFAKEVGNSCRYMQECHDWKLVRVLAYRDGENTADFGTKSEAKASIFSAADLGHPSSNSPQWGALEDIVARCGTAVVEAGMLFPDADSRLNKERLVAVFDKLIHRTEGAQLQSDSDARAASGGNGAATEKKSLFSADFLDVRGGGLSAPSSPLTSARKVSAKPSSASVRSDHSTHKDVDLRTLFTPVKSGHSNNPNGVPEDDEAEAANNMLDPTFSDLDRLCRDSFVRKLLQQELARGTGSSGGDERAVLVYVPCRIRFTLLAQLTPRMSWGVSAVRHSYGTTGTPHSQGQGHGQSQEQPRTQATRPQENYSAITGHQPRPLAIGSDHAVARLVGSTLWLSVEAARSVWGCAAEGEAQCILHEARQRHVAYHRCIAHCNHTGAYRHAMVSTLLTQTYRLTGSLYRAFGGAGFQLRRLVEVMELCRHALIGDGTSYDVTAMAMTVARHVCLGTRLLLTSPQVAHFRGGCAYLLKGVKRLEVLLQLAPIEVTQGAGALPRQLAAVSFVGPSPLGVQGKDNGPPASVQPSTAAKQKATATQATDGPTRPKVKPEDRDFEIALGRPGQSAERSAAARTVPFEALPPPVGATQTVAAAAQGPSVTSDAKAGSTVAALASTGENQVRRAIAQPAVIEECAALLLELSGIAQGLLFALNEDLVANFPDVDEYMKQKPESAAQWDRVPAAALGLGLRADGQPKRPASDPASYRPPRMVSSADALEDALGKDCTIEALVAYIHRAETPVNAALDDPDFERLVGDAAAMRRFKAAIAEEVFSDRVQARLADLRRIADISGDLSSEEKVAVKEIVYLSALPPSKKASVSVINGDQEQVSAQSGESEAVIAEHAAAVGGGKGRVHRTATMRFRAGAEVVRLLAEGANARKLAELRGQQDRGTAAADALEQESALIASDSAATLLTVDSSGALPPALEAAIPREALQKKLHRVSSAVMELAAGKKGISSLLQKMNMHLDPEKQATSAGAAEEGRESEAAPPGLGVSDSIAGLGSMVSAATVTSVGAKTGLANIHNVVDAIFRKRSSSNASAAGTGEPDLLLAPSFASLGTVPSAASLYQGGGFSRPPVEFKLSRFHDEATRPTPPPLSVDRSTERLPRRSLEGDDLCGDGGEDVFLSSMRPSVSEAGILVPPAVRVLQQAQQLTGSGEGGSMLQLLRACVQTAEPSAASPDRGLPARPMQLGYSSSAGRGRAYEEPAIEPGGVLEALRRRPKPDHQAEREVYF